MMILALAVLLLAAPAWATVTITATHLGDKVVEISYDARSETELVRAFALDITVTDGNIVDIGNFDAGDDNSTYGIFPGNFSRYITVNGTTGDVDDWDVAEYTPVADGADPGAQGGLGTPGITIEMGALYETNAPDPCGVLCTITVSEDCQVELALNGMRGNVVLETAEEPLEEVELIGCEVISDCFPTSHPDYDMWVDLEKPDCWCAPPFGSGYQCVGDADGIDSGIPFKFRVFTGDLTMIVNNWRKKAADLKGTLGACADVDHTDSGIPFKFQVFTGDLTMIVNNWRKKDADLDVGGQKPCP